MNEDQILAKRHRLRHVELFDVSGDELDHIEKIAESVGSDLQFATLWIPIGLTSLLTLFLVQIPSERVYLSYLCVTLVSFALGIYFLVRWRGTRGELKASINKIRERQVGPIGEQGKELKPSELASLPSVSPTTQNEEGK